MQFFNWCQKDLHSTNFTIACHSCFTYVSPITRLFQIKNVLISLTQCEFQLFSDCKMRVATRTHCYYGKQLVPISRFDTSYKRVMIVCNIISSTFFPSGRSILVFFPASLLTRCYRHVRVLLDFCFSSNFTRYFESDS